MQKIFISERVSSSENRTAQIFQIYKEPVFVVDCYQDSLIVSSEIVPRQRLAEQIAERFCESKDHNE